MKFFAQPTDPPQPKTKDVRKISFLLAGVLLIMIVTQLFTFEKFPEVIAVGLPINEATAKILAAFIVTLEVFSLPYLLRMRLSPAMRVVSMAAGWVVIGLWLIISLFIDKNTVSSLFGATLTLPAGWWMVFFTLGLGILAGWVAWGMWPLESRGKK